MEQEFEFEVSWAMTAKVKVKAESYDEAYQLAKDIDLPHDGEYLSDSFQVNDLEDEA